LCLALFAADPLAAQDPPTARDTPELYLLIRNRRHQEALSAADQLAKTGQHQPALDALQWILDRPFDALVRDDTGEFRSARAEAERRLDALSGQAKEQYQRITGAAAAGEWNRLRAPHDAAGCLAIVRSYFATESGYQAASTLVSRWLDDGNADLAAALALRVIDESAHRRRITTAFLRRAELACEAAGREDDARRIREQYLNRTADLAPPVMPARVSPRTVEASRSHFSLASAAPLPQPLWQQPLESVQPFPQLADYWRQWSADKRDRDQPTALAWRPIVVGDQLIHRDIQAIRAIDIRSGEPLWRHATQLGAEQLLSQSGMEGTIARRQQGEYWEMLFANSLVGTLSTDGQRVYAIDQAESLLTPSRRNFDPRQWDDNAMRQARNALVAINVWAEDEAGRLAWSTQTAAEQAESPLAGHVFLGPPAVAGGMAYCLTENDRELFTVALEASTGYVLWRQPVALAEHSLLEDRQRSLRAAMPTVARGLVLCPTNVGLLVAVDAVTGGFAWYHSCLEPSREARPSAFRVTLIQPHKRHSSFAPTVHTAGDRAVYLPSQSEHVFCLDLTTGREVWRASPADSEYIGGVTDEQVIVVGRGTCRSLSLEDGAEQWVARLESVPAGTGVLLADGYLLPLDSGRVLSLSLQDGRPLGFDFSEERRPVGHLVLSPDALVAVGGEGATAYASAGPTLLRLQRDGPNDANHWSSLADVHLTQGDLPRAVEALQRALRQFDDERPRQRAERTLREVYFRLLTDQPAQAGEWFKQLEPLCVTAEQKARRLIALSNWHLQAGREAEAVAAGLSLASLAEDTTLHAAPVQPGLSVSIPVWLATLERRVKPASSLASQLQTASVSGGATASRVAEFAFRDSSLAREVRAHLAAQDFAAGHWHSAELRWLRAALQTDRSAAARATLQLARMYDAAGLSARAAEQLDQLAHRFGDLEIENGQTGRQILRDWADDSPAKDAWQRRQPVGWPVRVVQMELVPRSRDTVGDLAAKPAAFGDENPDLLYGDYQRTLRPTQADAPYEWLIKSWGGTSTLNVFDKTSSRLMRSLSIPAGAAWPNRDASSLLGSSQSFGVPSQVRCVSLLQGGSDGLAWSMTLPGWSERSSIPSAGPSTPFGAVFQLRNELIVVDPADGRVLWRRDDLEPGSGIPADSAIGLLADERIVFVLSSDRQSYRVYDMLTGQLVRQARLEHDLKHPRQAIGTLVHHFVDSPEGRTLRLWDAATEDLLIDEPVRDKTQTTITNFDRDVVWLTPGGRLRVYDVSTRRQVVDCALEPEEYEGVTALSVAFAQGGRYFVNLRRGQQVVNADHYHEWVRDPLVPMVNVRDDVLCVEPGQERPLWRRALPSRSMVQWGQTPVPVLVGASIVKARDDNQKRWLRVEALDPATGTRVGFADRLPEMKLYHAEYDGASGEIRLVGERGDVVLKLGKVAM
jgi:outer membrane protein assembly factor BamB/tetratricopeptide (TPR) repeat protein